jgi:osmotically inducible lipoprotein OsmB
MTTRQRRAHAASDVPRPEPPAVFGVYSPTRNGFEPCMHGSIEVVLSPPMHSPDSERTSSRQGKAVKRLLVLVVALGVLMTAGCSGMSARQQRALSGGAIGAAGGAATGAITGGSPAAGAAVGGAAGATTGYFWDRIFGR